jgi:phosphoglycolate phosphatase-like HAD superfamily hydrolase
VAVGLIRTRFDTGPGSGPGMISGALGNDGGMNQTLRPGVLFDVDGTLLDTNYLHTVAWARALRDNGREGVPMSAVHRAIGIASTGLVERLLGEPDPAVVDAHAEHFEQLRGEVARLPGAPALVQACSDRGLVPVLATSGKEKDLDWMVPAIGAGDALAGATTSSDVDQGKPAPDLIAAALEQHGLDPGRSVVVGDSVWDVHSSTDAGLPCIGLLSGGISSGELVAAGAAEVYDDPAELLARLDASLLARL